MDSYMYIRALEYANKKHKGQFRHNGESYIVHPIEVSLKFLPGSADWKTRIVAILHDVLEDTDSAEIDLEILFGKEIAEAVQVLTRPKESWIPYESYIKHIKNRNNPLSTAVKIADLKHNLSTINNIKDEDKRNRLKSRYEKALETLK